MKKNTVFGTSKFSEITGLSPPTLMRYHKNGKLKAGINKEGDRIYTINDFFNDAVVAHMEKKRLDVPMEIKRAFLGENPPPVVVVDPVDEKPKTRKMYKTTTASQLAELPEGLLTEVLHPFETLGLIGRTIWAVSIKTLVAQETFKVADMPTLINYCSVADGLHAMQMELSVETSLLDYEGKINPLIAAIDKQTSKMKVLATVLHLTPDSRKNLQVVEKPKEDTHTAGWNGALTKV
jgi:phage terminase small subunit